MSKSKLDATNEQGPLIGGRPMWRSLRKAFTASFSAAGMAAAAACGPGVGPAQVPTRALPSGSSATLTKTLPALKPPPPLPTLPGLNVGEHVKLVYSHSDWGTDGGQTDVFTVPGASRTENVVSNSPIVVGVGEEQGSFGVYVESEQPGIKITKAEVTIGSRPYAMPHNSYLQSKAYRQFVKTYLNPSQSEAMFQENEFNAGCSDLPKERHLPVAVRATLSNGANVVAFDEVDSARQVQGQSCMPAEGTVLGF